jgi:hypothetical protein
MRPIPSVAHARFGVFTTAQANATGWTSHGLRHAVATGRLVRLRPGVYALPIPVTGDPAEAARRLQRDAAGVSLANPRVPVSHSAAGAVFGLPLLTVPGPVCATVPRGFRDEIVGTHLHRAALRRVEVFRHRSTLVTSAARTVLDLAREQGVDAGLVAADHAIRVGLAFAADLDAVLERCRGWPGLGAAQEVRRLIDPLSESPLESLSRRRIAQAGLPAPATQVELSDHTGRWLARVDFYWAEFGVVGETDGLLKYRTGSSIGSDRALIAEKLRQERLEEAGLIIVRWGWAAVSDFDPVTDRLRRAFARGSRPDRAERRWRADARTWYRTGAAG